jgi:hypothetical protein
MVASAANEWVTSLALLARTQSSCINKDGQRRVRKLARKANKKHRERTGIILWHAAMAAALVMAT